MIQIIYIKLNVVLHRDNTRWTNRLLSFPALVYVPAVNLASLAKCPPDEPGLMFPAAVIDGLSVLLLGGQGESAMITEKSIWNNPLSIRRRSSRPDRAGGRHKTIHSFPSRSHSGNILVESVGHSLDVRCTPIGSYTWSPTSGSTVRGGASLEEAGH